MGDRSWKEEILKSHNPINPGSDKLPLGPGLQIKNPLTISSIEVGLQQTT